METNPMQGNRAARRAASKASRQPKGLSLIHI